MANLEIPSLKAANNRAAQHTPGPWHATSPIKQKVWVYSQERRGGTQLQVAEVGNAFNSVGDAERVDADARLIAAAPDLLIKIAEAAEFGHDYDGRDWQVFVFECEELIAKARGEG